MPNALQYKIKHCLSLLRDNLWKRQTLPSDMLWYGCCVPIFVLMQGLNHCEPETELQGGWVPPVQIQNPHLITRTLCWAVFRGNPKKIPPPCLSAVEVIFTEMDWTYWFPEIPLHWDVRPKLWWLKTHYPSQAHQLCAKCCFFSRFWQRCNENAEHLWRKNRNFQKSIVVVRFCV